MIFPEDFKQFNNTLTKTRTRTGSSSGHFKRLIVQLRRHKSRWSPKISKFFPVNHGVSKTLEGFCMLSKNYWRQNLRGESLTDVRLTIQTQTRASCRRESDVSKCKLYTKMWMLRLTLNVIVTSIIETRVWVVSRLQVNTRASVASRFNSDASL